jgi:hypothetical protein
MHNFKITEMQKQAYLEDLFKLEQLESYLTELKNKKNNLELELLSLKSNLPIIVENSNKIALLKAKNQDFLNNYNGQIENLKAEQNLIMSNTKFDNLAVDELNRLYEKTFATVEVVS